MKTTVTTYACDVCKTEGKVSEETPMHVVFTTEQTEGRGCAPHLYAVKLDLCRDCLNKVLVDGKMIFAHGAQGHNTYYFK